MEVLVCPETRQRLRALDSDRVARLNEEIRAGKRKRVSGEPQKEVVEAALLREDGRVAYPILEGLVVLMRDEGIVLEEA